MKKIGHILLIVILLIFTGYTSMVINNIISNNQNNKLQSESTINNENNKMELESKVSKEKADVTNTIPKEHININIVLNKKVIVIDPGHANRSNLEKEPNAPGSKIMKIKDGGGATGINTKTPEYIINMEVSKKLQSHLEKSGFNVIMTKTEHSQSLGNVERAQIANKKKADLCIRIHCDSNKDTSVQGASMLVPQPINTNTKTISEKSKAYGKIILKILTEQVGMKSRGIILSKDMTGFNWSEVPVVLVEMGFLSNAEEDEKLSSSEYQDKIAKALSDGIVEALK